MTFFSQDLPRQKNVENFYLRNLKIQKKNFIKKIGENFI